MKAACACGVCPTACADCVCHLYVYVSFFQPTFSGLRVQVRFRFRIELGLDISLY